MIRAFVAVVLLFSLTAILRAQETLIVASIRQYQLIGSSNIHLYLYGLDGTLKKQLTDTAGCNDVNPGFSYDGKSVFFTRQSTIPKTAGEAGLYQLDLATGAMTRAKEDESDFNVPVESLENSYAVPADSWNVAEKNNCLSPDGIYRITTKARPSSDPNVNPPMLSLRTARKYRETVNCCYLEWWDSHFNLTKLTPPLSVFYSATVFHPVTGQPNPANETLQIGSFP